MNPEIKKRLISWVSHNPESCKPPDKKRLYDLVYECYLCNESVNEIDIGFAINTHKTWSDDFVLVFVDEALNRIALLLDMLKYLQRRGITVTVKKK